MPPAKISRLVFLFALIAFTAAIVGRVEVQRPSSDSTNLSVGVAFSF